MIFKRTVKVDNDNLDNIIEQVRSLKWGNINFIFYEENIYVDTIYIPAVRKKWMGKIIKNKLLYNFEDIKKLCYNYEIVHKDANKYSVRLYCINSKKNLLFDYINRGSRVTGVYLIQLCYLYFFRRKLKLEEFALIFNSRGYTYILSFFRGALSSSSILKHDSYEISILTEAVKDIIRNTEDCSGIDKILIVLVNYDNKEYASELSQHFTVRDMGFISEEKIIKKYVGVV